MRKHPLLELVLALALAAAPLAAAEPLTIGLSIPMADHGWTGGINWWAKKAITEFEGLNPELRFILVTADTSDKQAADIDDLMTHGLGALVVMPHDPARLVPALRKIKEAGVYAVVVDRIVPEMPRDVYVAGDNSGFGRECGEFLARELDGRGDFVIMTGLPSEGHTQRVEAFHQAIRPYPDLKVLESRPTDWNPRKGLEAMEDYLRKFEKIDAVWCQDDDVLEGVLQAYKASGRRDIKLMLGGGGSRPVIRMILNGDPLVRGTINFTPKIIHDGVRLAVDHLIDGRDFPAEVIIPSELVTRANGAAFYYPDSVY